MSLNPWLKSSQTRPLFPPGTMVRVIGSHTLLVGKQKIVCTGQTARVVEYSHIADCFVVELSPPPHHTTWVSEYEIEKL